jgi:hypothetical protein
LGGAAKVGKSLFAAEIATAVASGTACAGHFAALDPGPVVIFSAEDPRPVLSERLTAFARARGRSLESLPIRIIVEPVKLPGGIARLTATLAQIRPHLLIIDTLIRCHDADENSSQEMSRVLDGLRELARSSESSIIALHHIRKAQPGSSLGHGLRGSTDISAFGDVNGYLRRVGHDGNLLELRLEHRCTASPPPLRLRLESDERGPIRFAVASVSAAATGGTTPVAASLSGRVLAILSESPEPVSTTALRDALGVRRKAVLDALRELVDAHRIVRKGQHGWTQYPVPVPYIDGYSDGYSPKHDQRTTAARTTSQARLPGVDDVPARPRTGARRRGPAPTPK